MKTFFKALLAASMLMPVAAQAQDMAERGPGRRGGGEWRAPGGGPRGEGGGPPRSAEVGVDAQIRAERPQWRGERPDQPRPDQPRPGPDGRGPDGRGPDGRGLDGRGPEGRGPDWRRPDRPDPGFERRPDWQRPDRPPVIGNDDRRGPDPRRDWGDRREQDQRRDWDRQQRERRDWDRQRDERRWIDQRGRAQERGWEQGWNDRGRVERRNDWDRQWRNDQRYNWSRYRALNRSAYRLPRYYAPSGWGYGYRRFGIGVSLSPILFSQSYWIDDPFAYRLPEAYGPYRWVRYYDDALLVDIRTGQVVDTVYDIFF